MGWPRLDGQEGRRLLTLAHHGCTVGSVRSGVVIGRGSTGLRVGNELPGRRCQAVAVAGHRLGQVVSGQWTR